ncbi:MAG: 2-amino-4-hydroxy-6-hydroxymethyldihydropteridine diphosphokinase [Prevotellaceae bacterium]|jgi:2-amino-4-hydroxy-6-hydroxymethyldihydropteridine diphosphokinase|nr:2-amino-4-hydroxy-6-hydroxymethyldihydropteridine diphosphokinase [Prevotellaceae bacterium]
MIVLLGLGSNLGNKEQNLRFAINEIEQHIGKIARASSFYESEPWGYCSKNSFLNAAVCVHSDLLPEQLLEACKAIEKAAGRTARTTAGYQDRVLDIDILYYGNCVLNTGQLQLPHPHIARRRFVLEPLCEIAPQFIDPLTGKTIKDMLADNLCA